MGLRIAHTSPHVVKVNVKLERIVAPTSNEIVYAGALRKCFERQELRDTLRKLNVEDVGELVMH